MEWPVLREEQEVGRITSAAERRKIRLTASCPFEEGWIYRLYIGTEAVPRGIYLGVMLPEGKRFTLRKQLLSSQLEALGEKDTFRGTIVRCRPGEAEPPEPISRAAERPMLPLPFGPSALGELPRDGGFPAEVFGSCGGRYVCHEGRGYYLAPGKPGEALGPAPFFCLLSWVSWQESGWWVLCTDGEGQPISCSCLPE